MEESFAEYVRDQLQEMRGLRLRRMFGGYGVYCGSMFFAIVHKDRLYFKTDAATRAAYEERGMQPFRPSAKQTLANYYEVPPDILDDASSLVEWARRALAAADKLPVNTKKRRTARLARD